MKAALQLHWKRVSDAFLEEEIYPVLSELGIEHELLPLEHNGNIPIADDVDFVLVLGGDGTFLTGAALALQQDLPILGVMIGRLGFLCSITLEQLKPTLKQLIGGKLATEDRYALVGSVFGSDGSCRLSRIAINDVVLFRHAGDNIREFRANHNDELIAHYRADGIIISSAVGSTAYTLAAGGPLVHPSLDVMVLTPICAHSLFTKPLVLPRDASVRIDVQAGSYPLEVSFDGNIKETIQQDEWISISSAPKCLKVFRPDGHEFYSVLRQKFQHGYLYGEADA